MERLTNVLFEKIVGNIVKLLGGVLVLTILLQILARYAMNHPFSWTEEFSRLVFIWFCMLSSTITLKRKLHIGIDFVYNKLSLRSRKGLEIIIHLFIFLFGLLLLYYGSKLLLTTINQKTEILRWPSAVYFSSVPLVGMFYCLLSSVEILKQVKQTV
jgi:TRAP-type C4-dicarboxylate transport system permease small subunit